MLLLAARIDIVIKFLPFQSLFCIAFTMLSALIVGSILAMWKGILGSK